MLVYNFVSLASHGSSTYEYNNLSKPGVTLQFIMILHCFTQNFGWESWIKSLLDFITQIHQTKNLTSFSEKNVQKEPLNLFLWKTKFILMLYFFKNHLLSNDIISQAHCLIHM